MSDRLTAWEKAALLTTGAASAFNVLLWALGAGLEAASPAWTALGILRVVFAVLGFVSLDLVVVVVVQAMRAGRRGWWSEVAAATAATFAALIALETAGVVAWAWLHAAPALVLYCFMRHLATEPRSVVAELRAELAELRAELERRAQEASQAERDAGRAWDVVAELRAELGQGASDEADAILRVAGRTYSLAQLASATGTPKTTLGRRLAALAQEGVGRSDG